MSWTGGDCVCQPCCPLASFMHLHVSVPRCRLCFSLLLKIAHLEGDLTPGQPVRADLQRILHQRCISCKSHTVCLVHTCLEWSFDLLTVPVWCWGRCQGQTTGIQWGPFNFAFCWSCFASPYFYNLMWITCTTFHAKWTMWKVVLESRFICTSFNAHFWRMLHRQVKKLHHLDQGKKLVSLINRQFWLLNSSTTAALSQKLQ